MGSIHGIARFEELEPRLFLSATPANDLLDLGELLLSRRPEGIDVFQAVRLQLSHSGFNWRSPERTPHKQGRAATIRLFGDAPRAEATRSAAAVSLLPETQESSTPEVLAETVTVNRRVTHYPNRDITGMIYDDAAQLQVTVDGATYTEADATLQRDRLLDTWTLKGRLLSKPLAEGVYDVVAEAQDLAGNIARDTTSDELVIFDPGSVNVTKWPFTNSGTSGLHGFVEDDDAELTVTFNGELYMENGGIGRHRDQNRWFVTRLWEEPLAAGTYPLELTAVDRAGNVTTTIYEVVVDMTPPQVVSGQLTPGRYNAGDVIEIKVTWDEPVYMTFDEPCFDLSIGGELARAWCVSGSGTDTLTFHYTVPEGVNTAADGIHLADYVNSFLCDAAGNRADSATNFGSPVPGLIVDTKAPTPTLRVNGGELHSSFVNSVEVVFDEVVTPDADKFSLWQYVDGNWQPVDLSSFTPTINSDGGKTTVAWEFDNALPAVMHYEVRCDAGGATDLAGNGLRGTTTREGRDCWVAGFDKLPGDFNGDGLVTHGDYTIWTRTFVDDGSYGNLSGDANGDGRVTHADYTLWADFFGRVVEKPAV